MPKTHDIFVAYAGPDRAVATELVTELHKRGILAVWDGSIPSEETFSNAIPELIAASRVFTILVSPGTWIGQHYATEELSLAVQYARSSGIAISPVWLQPIAIENRPYGIATKIGVSLTDNHGCLGCVAGRLAEVVLRTQLVAAASAISFAITQQKIPDLPIMINPSFSKKEAPTSPALASQQLTEYQAARTPDGSRLGGRRDQVRE